MKKGQIFIVIVMLLMVGILSAYKIDMDKMRKGEDVVFSTWGVKYRPSVKETESGEKQTLKKETIKILQRQIYYLLVKCVLHLLLLKPTLLVLQCKFLKQNIQCQLLL